MGKQVYYSWKYIIVPFPACMIIFKIEKVKEKKEIQNSKTVPSGKWYLYGHKAMSVFNQI